jgi:hypothetical protein
MKMQHIARLKMQEAQTSSFSAIEAVASFKDRPGGTPIPEEARQPHNPDLCSVHFPYHINPELSSAK